MPVDTHTPGPMARRRRGLLAPAPQGVRGRIALRRLASPPTVGPLERALALRSLPLFHNIRARQLASLAQHMREHVAPGGSILHTAGEPVRAVHLLTDGRVRQERDGRAVALLEAPQAPEALGLIHLLARQAPSTTAIAETDVSSLVIDGAALLDVLEEHFSVVLHIHGVLAREIAALQTELGRCDHPTPEVRAEPLCADPFDIVNCLLCLQRAPALRGLGIAVLASLLRDHAPVRFTAGEELFAAGGEATRFLVLLRGEVSGTPPAEAARFRARVGDALGQDAALAGLPYPYTAVAETSAAAVAIDAQVFWDVAEDHFHVARAALATCAGRLLWLRDQREAGTRGSHPASPAASQIEEEP